MLKRVISDESGRTLAWTLIIMSIGALLIPTFLSHASTNLLAARATEEGLRELYAADSGVEYVLLQLKNGVLEGQQGYGINNRYVEVTWRVYISPTTYVITSVATSLIDGSSTTIVSHVGSVESETVESSGSPVFEYAVASLDGDVTLDGSSKVEAEGTDCGAKAHANGNIVLDWSTKVDGIANATGTVDIPEWGYPPDFYCEEHEGVDQLVPPEVSTSTYKAEAQDVQCAQCAACGDYTHTNWDEDPGTYGRVHASGWMNIGSWWPTGPYQFTDTVCAGTDIDIVGNEREVIFNGSVKAGQDLNITGSEAITFKGPVCVGQDLEISSGSGDVMLVFEGPVKVEGNLYIGGARPVTFKSTVCVGQLLEVGGSGDLVFEGPVQVGGNLDIGGGRPTAFDDTIYVEGDMIVTNYGENIPLGGTVYVCGNIVMGGDVGFEGGATIVAEGNVTVGGSAKLNLDDIPLFISLGDSVGFSGAAWVSAAVYAPYANITLSGSSKVYGALVGKAVSMDGAAIVEYPLELASRVDLPGMGDEGGDEGGGMEVMTYNVNP